MVPYMQEWKKLDLHFNGICSGFLGSKEQIEIVKKFFKEFKTEETQIIVDPVMGDYGKPYPTYTEEMCDEMKKLVEFADILTPNVTEACVLTDTPYKEKWKIEEIQEMAEKIHKMGPKKIAITGIVQGGFIANFCYEEGQQPKVLRTHKEGTQRSGTGDIFASIIAADAVNGVPFYKSVKKASDFIKKCIIRSQELNIPLTDGVCFEEVHDNIYVNLTNKCPCACTFCLRQTRDHMENSHVLWLEHAPSFEEVQEAMKAVDFSKYKEVVFCGFGEPTEALDVLKQSAKLIKEKYNMPIRINTNGLGSLVNERDIVPELKGLVDTISVSLNTPNADEYHRLVRSKFGEKSFDAMIDFTKECTKYIPNVVMTTVETTITHEEEKQCQEICDRVGAKYRIRPWED